MLGWLAGAAWLLALNGRLPWLLRFDADALGTADLWGALAQGGRLGSWTFGPHPYLFPDLPLYGLAAAWREGVAPRQAAYALLVGLLLWLLLARLFRALWALGASEARFLAAAGLLLPLPFADGAGWGAVFTPGFHGGALLVSLAFLAWAVERRGRPATWSGVLGFGLLGGLAWASDQVTPAWLLLPGFLAAWGDRRALRAVAASGLFALLVRALLLRALRGEGAAVAHFVWPGLGAMAQRARALADPSAWAGWGGLLAAGLAVTAALALVPGAATEERAVAAGLAAASAAGLALSVGEASAQARYFLFPVWLGLPLAVPLAARWTRGQAWGALAAFLLAALSLARPAPAPADPYRSAAAWLSDRARERGWTVGLAPYAWARPLRLLDGGKPLVLPAQATGGGLVPDPWEADRSQFAAGGRIQFVVLGALDPGAVRAVLGPPRAVLSGEGLTVWELGGAWGETHGPT